MHCVITAGPTYEPLDEVRRLTNSSTGRLGCELAAFLQARGHSVTLLLGEQASYCHDLEGVSVLPFGTGDHLRRRLTELSTQTVHAVFHAAAVSDFAFGKTWTRNSRGELSPVQGGKIISRDGTLFAELIPTPKIIAEVRTWFADACIVGWKYEVDGDRERTLRAAREQLAACHTDACVANGPAYGDGFGLVVSSRSCTHFGGRVELFQGLAALLPE